MTLPYPSKFLKKIFTLIAYKIFSSGNFTFLSAWKITSTQFPSKQNLKNLNVKILTFSISAVEDCCVIFLFFLGLNSTRVLFFRYLTYKPCITEETRESRAFEKRSNARLSARNARETLCTCAQFNNAEVKFKTSSSC